MQFGEDQRSFLEIPSLTRIAVAGHGIFEMNLRARNSPTRRSSSRRLLAADGLVAFAFRLMRHLAGA
jgi:hypothetical protein